MDAAGVDANINPAPVGASWLHQATVDWPELQDTASCRAENADAAALRMAFERDGRGSSRCPPRTCHCTATVRPHALGRHRREQHAARPGQPRAREARRSENVGQIMWPSDLVAGLRDGPCTGARCRRRPASTKAAPSASRWRSILTCSFTRMHYGHGCAVASGRRVLAVGHGRHPRHDLLGRTGRSHGAERLPVVRAGQPPRGGARPHRTASADSHVLMTEHCSEREGVPVELPAGSCMPPRPTTTAVATARRRHAACTSPTTSSMIKWERDQGSTTADG